MLYAGLRRINVTDLGSVSAASYVIADYYIFAISVAVDLHERPGSIMKFVISFPLPFCLYSKFRLANCEA